MISRRGLAIASSLLALGWVSPADVEALAYDGPSGQVSVAPGASSPVAIARSGDRLAIVLHERPVAPLPTGSISVLSHELPSARPTEPAISRARDVHLGGERFPLLRISFE